MVESIPIFIGFDKREAVAYHVCCQSIIERSSMPVELHPLHLDLFREYEETHKDGSNAFIYSRFLVPWLMNYKGWAIFMDGDMIVREDIAELWGLRDLNKAVQVVKHDYKTKHPTKYLGSKNEDYPRKNWSSVILWYCGHFHNRDLDPAFVGKSEGSLLHRFGWLDDSLVGALPIEWNHLCSEYEDAKASLYHYTIGVSGFREYNDSSHSDEWFEELSKSLHLEGQGHEVLFKRLARQRREVGNKVLGEGSQD